MIQTATPKTEVLTSAALVDGMAQIVLMVEWMVKQQQQLSIQQRVIEDQRQQIESLKKENED